MNNLKVLLSGEGGQGVQAIGQILNEAATKNGFESIYLPNFGVEQRGGVSLAYVQISRSPLTYPKFKIADLLIVLCPRSILRVKNYYNGRTKILNLIGFEEKLKEHELSYRTFNMLALGIISEFLPLEKEIIIETLVKKFQAKKILPELVSQNKKAFLVGRVMGMRLPSRTHSLDYKGDTKNKRDKITFEDDKKHWQINPGHCKSCGICVYRCPSKALSFNPKIGGVYGMPTSTCDIKRCIGCGLCERVCPEGAIEVKKKK